MLVLRIGDGDGAGDADGIVASDSGTDGVLWCLMEPCLALALILGFLDVNAVGMFFGDLLMARGV